MTNQQAVEESLELIKAAFDDNVRNLENDEYKEVLEDLIGDFRTRLNALEEEMEEEENIDGDF